MIFEKEVHLENRYDNRKRVESYFFLLPSDHDRKPDPAFVYSH